MLIQVGLVIDDESIRNDLAQLILNIIEGIYVILGLIFVTVMLVFHCYLAGQNVTTNEYCKNMWQAISGNPFKKYSFLHLGVIVSKISPK